jgi:hypothetical protein
MKMRTMLILTLLSVGLLLAGTGIAGADVIVSTGVFASATLEVVNTLTVQPVPYAGGTAPKIDFHSIPAGRAFASATEYIKVTHDDNSLAWEIKIYTNNFATEPSTTTWGYNYGGMIGLVPGARLPMAWHAETADFVSSPFAVGSATTTPSVGWNFVKDKRDKDIPGTPEDESWLGPNDAGEHGKGTAGYANVAYGGPDYQKVIDPRVGSPEYGYLDGDKIFTVEVEGISSAASADTYGTTISFDLVHK